MGGVHIHRTFPSKFPTGRIDKTEKLKSCEVLTKYGARIVKDGKIDENTAVEPR